MINNTYLIAISHLNKIIQLYYKSQLLASSSRSPEPRLLYWPGCSYSLSGHPEVHDSMLIICSFPLVGSHLLCLNLGLYVYGQVLLAITTAL